MKIGLITDSHDHLENLDRVLKELKEKDIEVLLHAGDICSPFVLPMLDEIGVPVHLVFGNNDGDKYALTSMCHTELKHCVLHGELAEVNLDKVRIAMTHYPKIAYGLAESENYDLVVYGHTHVIDEKKIDNCLIVNSGEVMGRKGKVSYGIFDTDTKEVEVCVVDK